MLRTEDILLQYAPEVEATVSYAIELGELMRAGIRPTPGVWQEYASPMFFAGSSLVRTWTEERHDGTSRGHVMISEEAARLMRLVEAHRHDDEPVRELGIDVETYSEVPIKDCGAHRYIEDDSFEILLFAYSVNGGPVAIVDMAQGEEIPQRILDALEDPDCLKTAWNAAFERNALGKMLGRRLDPHQWECTMVTAAASGYPISLDEAGKALGLPEDSRKMKEGKDLIRFFCVPRKVRPGMSGPAARKRNLPHHDFEKWETFKAYCVRDVETEQHIRGLLRDRRLSRGERELYAIDQDINDRGVLCDLRLAANASRMYREHCGALLQEAKELSGLENPNSVSQLKGLLGVGSLNKKVLPDIKAKADDAMRRVLEIREATGKTPIRKYDTMLAAACRDGRVRGCLQFNGTRTARWAGRILQVQNLPQNHITEIGFARQLVLDGDAESLEMVYGDIPSTLSQLIRTALVAPEGQQLIVCDYSAIEARVIAWLAGEEWVLDAFRNGEDIYCATASKMYGVPVEKHGVNAHLRDKGKRATLGCGFGGGVNALKAFGADKYMTEEQMKETVDRYREANPNIVKLWYDLEKMFFKSLSDGRRHATHGVVVGKDGDDMYMELPSGRRVYYPGMHIAENRFGRKALAFMGVNQTTRKWEEIETYYGKLTENLVQSVARDCLARCITALEHDGYRIVMHIHDEVVIEARDGQTLEQVEKYFANVPGWAKGLPLKGAGYVTPYYLKD